MMKNCLRTWSEPNAKFSFDYVLHLLIKLDISSLALCSELQILIRNDPAALFAVAFYQETVPSEHVSHVTIRILAAQPRTDVSLAYLAYILVVSGVASFCQPRSGVQL